mmetsp:Transcript_14065/g.38238  ORF Transcript_14065/g.38238 Transcript_14065/m.38238 type:complete len:202 (-) Transcript_14065:133-738(-)
MRPHVGGGCCRRCGRHHDCVLESIERGLRGAAAGRGNHRPRRLLVGGDIRPRGHDVDGNLGLEGFSRGRGSRRLCRGGPRLPRKQLSLIEGEALRGDASAWLFFALHCSVSRPGDWPRPCKSMSNGDGPSLLAELRSDQVPELAGVGSSGLLTNRLEWPPSPINNRGRPGHEHKPHRRQQQWWRPRRSSAQGQGSLSGGAA